MGLQSAEESTRLELVNFRHRAVCAVAGIVQIGRRIIAMMMAAMGPVGTGFRLEWGFRFAGRAA